MNLQDFLVPGGTTVPECLARLDATAKGCLFVVDSEGRLAGSLSDGDVRRHILRTGGLAGTALDAANRDPVSAGEGGRPSPAKVSAMSGVSAVPVLDADGRVADIVFRDGAELARGRLGSPVPVVMMAGGKGTRLLPYTAVLPKPLVPVAGKAIAERIIERFHEGGCGPFHLVLNYRRRMIRAYFDELDPPYEVRFVDEEEYRGTGGGLKLLEGEVGGTFILTNCDILVDVDLPGLLAAHRASGDAVTIVCSLKCYTIPYGTIEIGEGGEVAAMREKPTVPSLINTGVYVVEPGVLGLIGEDEAVGFPDVVARCMEVGMGVGVYPVSEGSWLDMGEPDELQRMADALSREAAE